MGRKRVDGIPVTISDTRQDAPSIFAGHVTVVWRLGGRTLAVSLHGFERRPIAIEMAEAVIAQMRQCGTEGGKGAEPPCRLVFPARH